MADPSDSDAERARLMAEIQRLQVQCERLRMLSDRAVDTVLLHDGKGRMIDANRTAWEYLGYTREEFLALNIRDLDVGLQSIPLERYGQNWARMRPGVTVTAESEHRHKDGHLIPIEVRVAVYEQDGQRLFVATCRDVTQRRAAERDRELSERRFRAVFEGSPLAMVFVDTAGRLVQANPAACNLLGYTEAQLTAKSIRDIWFEEDALVGRQELQELWAGTRSYLHVEKRCVTSAGAVIWLEISAFRDEVRDAGSVRAVAFLEDIGERKAIERQRQELFAQLEVLVSERTQQLTAVNARLEQEARERERVQADLSAAKLAAETANHAKTAFLTNMSHELRTPLNAVIGYSEMLVEEAQDLQRPQMVSDLERIRSSGKHLLGIINDILDLSKVEAGKMELLLEEGSIDALLDDVLNGVRPLAEARKNALQLIKPAPIGLARTDLTRLRQVLLNLMSNACKFTERGRVSLRAEKQVIDGERWTSFAVQDTGIGIKPAELERLFEPFVQADVSTTRKYGGTGLGLSITRILCEMLGGSLQVESTFGAGSTFTVLLPVRHPASTPPPA
jgi:PAS domain S-box-containing protein